jgi:Fic family protein
VAHDERRGSDRLRPLLTEPTFEALASEAVLDYIDWNELLGRPLPAGMSAQETWQALTAVRRFGAIRFPLRDMDGREYWYTLTREARLCLDAVERYCRTDSSVHRAIQHRHGQRLLIESRIREAVAVMQLDGVVLDEGAGREMILRDRSPRTSTEQMLANIYDLVDSVDSWIAEPFSPDLLSRLYDALIRDVDLSALSRDRIRHGLTGRVESRSVPLAVREEMLGRYCDYANQKSGDPSEPIAMKAHALLNAAHYWSLFPDFNGIMGRLVFRLFATQQDYPVLGFLPVASMYQAWLEGRGVPSFVRFKKLDLEHTVTSTDVDYTMDVLTYLQLTIAALDEMLSAIEHGRKRDAEVRSALEHDPEINYRQRAVISRALAHPEREFRIREHQKTHNVVYATARADLLDLTERGYLVQELRGKAFVFMPAPGLDVRVGANEPI